MRNLIVVAVVVAGVGIFVISRSQPPIHVVELDIPLAQNDPRNLRNPILRAREPHAGTIEAGKQRIPIIVDGTQYEIVVTAPKDPALYPAQPRNAD